MKKPPALAKGYKHNFEQLCKAHEEGVLALVSARRKDTGEARALVAAVFTDENSEFRVVPFAEMIPEDPYEIYEDPTKN